MKQRWFPQVGERIKVGPKGGKKRWGVVTLREIETAPIGPPGAQVAGPVSERIVIELEPR